MGSNTESHERGAMMHDEVFYARKIDSKCQGGNPHPVLIPPRQRGGLETQPAKNGAKTVRREYAQPSRYIFEFRRDVSNILSSDRGSQRQIWQSEPGVPFGQARRVKRREGEGDGAGRTHHGTSTFGLSCHRRLI